MPWNETTPMDQKMQFIADYLRGELSMTELCELYGIARKTGHKFVERYLKRGPRVWRSARVAPRTIPTRPPSTSSRRSWSCANVIPAGVPRSCCAVLEKRHPHWDLPGRSTVCDILSRHGMVPKKRTRRAIGHPGKPTS